MTNRTRSTVLKNGIGRVEKVTGATALEQMMRYNSGALRYELECAFVVLKRAAKVMSSANNEQLRALLAATAAANAVITAYFVHGDTVSEWSLTIADGVMHPQLEKKLLASMADIDDAVARLKVYL
jgi:hypothetical protein